MRILQLIQKQQLRGAELFACQLSNHLISCGHEVKIICLLDGDAQLPFTGTIVKLNRPLSKRFFDWEGWKILGQEIKSFNPDIIQANAGDTLKFAVFSKMISGWKTPIIFRNANKVSDFINSTPKRWFNKLLVNRVSHVISVSELCRLDFISTYSYSKNKTTTIPIGIEAKAINSAMPSDLISFFSGSRVLVNVASMVPEKNQLGLIAIMEQVVKNHPDVKLILIGDGRQKEEIKKRIEAKRLSDHILLAGYRNDVLSIMANAQAMVLPSLIEGLPGVILEAQYCKTSVIANNVGGVSEVVENDKSGWLITKGDELGFANAIDEMLVNQSKRSSMIDKAYVQVTEQYNNRDIAKRFIRVYEKLTAPRG